MSVLDPNAHFRAVYYYVEGAGSGSAADTGHCSQETTIAERTTREAVEDWAKRNCLQDRELHHIVYVGNGDSSIIWTQTNGWAGALSDMVFG